MNPAVATGAVIFGEVAMLLLIGWSFGWISGSKAERKRVEQEHKRAEALDRISREQKPMLKMSRVGSRPPVD